MPDVGFMQQSEVLQIQETIKICWFARCWAATFFLSFLFLFLHVSQLWTDKTDSQSGQKQRGMSETEGGLSECCVGPGSGRPLSLSTVNAVSVQKLKSTATGRDFR